MLSAKPSDMCAVKQLEEEIADLKSDVRSASRDLALLDLDEYDDLLKLEKALKGFTVTHYRRSILCHPRPLSLPAPTPAATAGVKLSRIDVPHFNGSIIHWRSFWEQFDVSVNSRTSLSDAEKLTYLQNALKDGKAKSVIEGLSQMGDHYQEAVDTPHSRFDRPRLVH